MDASVFTSQASAAEFLGFSVGQREPEKLQAAKPSLGCAWMCLAVQVGGALVLGLVKSR